MSNKFKKGDQVILLDFRHEHKGTVHAGKSYWVPQHMDKNIGKMFTISGIHYGGYMLASFGDFGNLTFNEHWLKKAEPLEEELFEI